MLPRYDEFELTDSAYRHGYNDEDFAEILRRPHLVIRSRRGKLVGYEIFGRNRRGAYLLAAGRIVESKGTKRFRVFHLNRMTGADRKRFARVIRP